MTRSIRVLAVDHTAGVAMFRKKFAALAAHPDIDLTVLAPDRWIENYNMVRAVPGDERGYRVRTGRVGWPGYENRGFFTSGIGPALRESRADILHLWEEPFSVITLEAIVLKSIWASHAKAIFFSSDNLSRNFRYSYRPSWFYGAVERLAHRGCAAGTAVTEDVADVLRAKGFRKPLEIIPHGLDLADYLPRPGESAGRSNNGVDFGLEHPIVGFVGRLLHQKGADLLLRAIALTSDRNPSVLIVGDGPERRALEALAGELGIADRTRFLPAVPHAEVPALLARVDVLVVPSRTTSRWVEQFGRVVIEGLAAGCLVIGSSSGSIPKVLGDAGFIFTEDDAESLASAIRQSLTQPRLASAVRGRGQERVRQNYTWEAIAVRLVDFYRRVLA